MFEPSAGKGRILVVDDNLANRKLAEAHLMASGYEVTLAEGGEKAIALFLENPHDLVLLDILMPQMNGFEACAKLRALRAGKDTPIVFLTALSDLETHEKAMASGADDFLTKPINRTELLIRVRSLIRVKMLNDEVKRAHRQKEELAALIVHDLKSPLTGILGNADLLIEDETLSDDVRASAQDIYRSAEAMHRMVLNILDISRSEDGSLTLRRQPLDIKALIDQVASGFERRAKERDQTLTRDVAPLPAISADRDLIERLLHNLLDNAMKYTPKRGHILVFARADDRRVEIAISDDGPGIPARFRDKVFEKYVQLEEGAAQHARTSRGLGLTFCKLAVEAHGGKIVAEERVPKGTTFRLELPV
jgi:two-component system, sensor histidine kinase and response regulator